MKKQNTRSGTIVGGASLLTIFAVLCLTVFVILALSTVLSAKRSSDISAEAVAAYYNADAHAEKILSDIRRGETPSEVIQEGNKYSYSCSVSETQTLFVEVIFENGTWQIIRWQTETNIQ